MSGIPGARQDRTTSAPFRVLGHRPFRLYFFGSSVSMFGDVVATIAITFALLNTGGSTSSLGLALAARYLPVAAFLLCGGVLADRLNRVKVMIWADITRMLCQAALAVIILATSVPVWTMFTVMFLYGAAEAFFTPAVTGLVQELVPSADLQTANGLVRTAQSLARLIGPGVGGVLVTLFGFGPVIAVDSLTFAINVALLCTVRRNVVNQRFSVAGDVLHELREGLSVVGRHAWLWASIANFTIFGGLVFPALVVLGPDFANQHLGGIHAWALVISTFGGGAVVGGLVSLYFRPSRPGVACAMFLALAALRPAVIASGAGLAVIGFYSLLSGAFMTIADVLWGTLLQERVPPTIICRVSSIDNLGVMLLSPIGYLVASPLAILLGIRSAMFGLAGLAASLCVAALAIPGLWTHHGAIHARTFAASASTVGQQP